MKNILVVDDYSTNVMLVKKALPEKKFSVRMASSGETALKALMNREEDLILLDTIMPNMDGIETLRRIKENPDTRDIPVIMLTNQTDKSKIVEGFALGAVDVIVKPIVAKTVIERVTRALNGESPGQLASKVKEEEADDAQFLNELLEDMNKEEEEEEEEIIEEDELDEGIW